MQSGMNSDKPKRKPNSRRNLDMALQRRFGAGIPPLTSTFSFAILFTQFTFGASAPEITIKD